MTDHFDKLFTLRSSPNGYAMTYTFSDIESRFVHHWDNPDFLVSGVHAKLREKLSTMQPGDTHTDHLGEIWTRTR